MESKNPTEIDEEAQRTSAIPSTELANNEHSDIESTSTSNAFPASKAIGVLDWDSSEDVDNPRNWTFSRRAFHTAVPALYGFVVFVHLTPKSLHC